MAPARGKKLIAIKAIIANQSNHSQSLPIKAIIPNHCQSKQSFPIIANQLPIKAI
jgi:hypothetical protein